MKVDTVKWQQLVDSATTDRDRRDDFISTRGFAGHVT